MKPEDLFEDNILGTDWIGEVVDIEDPKEEGRIKVKVFGKFDGLETEHIPWARSRINIGGGSTSGSGYHSVPKLGSTAAVVFTNGNIYEPEWYTLQHISDELKEEITGDNYLNAHSLIYDTEIEGSLKLFYTTEVGLMIDFNESQVNIRPDQSVFITFASGKVVHVLQDSISLGSEDKSAEPALLGDKSEDLYNDIITALNNLSTNLTTISAAMKTAGLAPSPVFGQLGWQAISPLIDKTNSQLVGDIAKMNIDIKKIKSKVVTLD